MDLRASVIDSPSASYLRMRPTCNCMGWTKQHTQGGCSMKRMRFVPDRFTMYDQADRVATLGTNGYALTTTVLHEPEVEYDRYKHTSESSVVIAMPR